MTGVWNVNNEMRNGIRSCFCLGMLDGHALLRWRRGERRDPHFVILMDIVVRVLKFLEKSITL